MINKREINNYYPFGLKHKGYNNVVNGTDHKYGFGGKEEQDEIGLGWIDITARNYDPALGRWMNLDPLAESFYHFTPYNYSFNSPSYFTDPTGLAPEGFGLIDWSAHDRWEKENEEKENDDQAVARTEKFVAFLSNVNEFAQDKLSFDDLWKNFENLKGSHRDKNGEECFSNYCAINLSEAMRESGVSFNNYNGATCWGCNIKNGTHPLRAEELASWLLKTKINGVAEGKTLTGGNFEDYVDGKKGIIFFKDYWVRAGSTQRTGDHIDLWKKNRLASIGWFLTWVRRTMPETSEQYFDMSDLRKSKKVIFWGMQ